MTNPQSHESKDSPKKIPDDKVVEAFGAQKCPKLVSQVAQSTNTKLRINALKVLTEELKNPYSAGGVTRAGVVPILNELSTHDDKNVKESATKALGALACDSNGRQSMIEEDTANAVLKAINDPSPTVRSNVYDALLNLSQIRAGITALVSAGYPTVLVEKSKTESNDDVRHLPLRLLYEVIKTEKGLNEALDCGAVEACIENLSHNDSLTKKDAAATLGFLCFADAAKITAIANGAVALLSELLEHHFWKVRAAAAGALMSIIQTDQGKMEMIPCGAIAKLIKLLKDEEDLVKLNVLKTLTEAVVHPAARKECVESTECLLTIESICNGDDEFLAKHAKTAREAVTWMP